MSNAVLKSEPQAIVACTISRDVQIFDLLIEDMEAALGENWGDLSFDDAASYLHQPEAASLRFVTIAMDHEDEDNLDQISHVISVAKSKDIKVILITEDVSPAALHQLLRVGGDEFIPYPLPEHELASAIDRVLTPTEQAPVTPEHNTALKPKGGHNGVIIPVHGMAGGTGATTFAVNLAWELATVSKTESPRVCIRYRSDGQRGLHARFAAI
jgi:pilus assembly protein CpaE